VVAAPHHHAFEDGLTPVIVLPRHASHCTEGYGDGFPERWPA
jgi:hypothetical protein